MTFTRFVPVLLASLALAGSAQAQSAPTKGWRAEFLSLWKSDQTKYEQLLAATPWEKFSYRPAPGVRSTCEVFLHIGADNYLLGKEIGGAVPKTFDAKTAERCPANKDAVLAMLKGGFESFAAAITKMTDADGEKPLKVFGEEFTYRGFAMMNLGHAGEHLGQSIAYARTNGIVPPWSK